MQKLSVLRYCFSETHRFFSTNSLCMMAICPAGPPKLIKPNFTQNQKASQKPTGLVCACSRCEVSVSISPSSLCDSTTRGSVTTVTLKRQVVYSPKLVERCSGNRTQ